MQIPTLKSTVTKLENAIITLSGPAIAISGIIAGIDLLTGGSMFKNIGWLSLTWAICLLLTLDFQVLMLGARAKQIYNGSKGNGKKFCEILAILAIAAAISYVSVQMQSIIARSQTTITSADRTGHQYTHTISIDEATKDMGINPIALIWERSSLVLILIFMSGWLRDEENGDQEKNTGAGSQIMGATSQTPGTTSPTTGTITQQTGAGPQTLGASGNQQSIAIDYTKLAQAILAAQATKVHEEKYTDPALLTAPKPADAQMGAGPQISGTSGSQPEPQPEAEEINPQDAEKIAAAYLKLQEANAILENPKPISARSLATNAKVRRTTCSKWLQTFGTTQEEREPDPNTEQENGSQSPNFGDQWEPPHKLREPLMGTHTKTAKTYYSRANRSRQSLMKLEA
jgi:hypothetical protein